MKKSLTFLILCLLYFCACRKNDVVPSNGKASADYDKAQALLAKQKDSAAFYYFNIVAGNSKTPLEAARAYNYMARLQSDAGDFFGSQESLSLSLKKLNPADTAHWRCLSSDYNELGLTSVSLKNYDTALGYFDQALSFKPNDTFRVAFLNNKALAYQKKGAMAQAINIYDQIITQAPDTEFYARILSNRARTKWLQDHHYNPVQDFLRALQLRQKIKDFWGQNASYIHLSDYYAVIKPDSAFYYAQKEYVIARQLGSPDDEAEALEKLIRLSSAAQVHPYFSRYLTLNDSLQTARNRAKNQFALIRYESEKIKKENTERKYEIIQQRIRYYSTLGFFVLIAVGAFFWYRKRKRQQKQETEQAVKDTQRKASKQVHDTLGNDIYRILKKVQNEPNLDREWLIANIDDVYKRARNLSYEINIDTGEHFPEHVFTLLQSFGSDDIRVILTGNKLVFWQKVQPVNKLELHYILQELMVNMQKHSKAANVVIKFEESGKQGRITYFDDGIGISAGTPQQNGLQNAVTRIKAIGGDFIFGNDTEKGLEIQLTFPIA